MPAKRPKPTDVELQVLSVLWEKKSATVREVLDLMPDGKDRSYTTVLTIMQLMEKKGLLKRSTEGRAHVYRAAYSRRGTMRPLLRDFVAKAFGGNPTNLIQQLIADEQLSSEHVEEIRFLLDELKPSKAGVTETTAEDRRNG